MADEPTEPPDDQWIRDFLAAEPERVRKLLAAAIKVTGETQRGIEKRLGWTHGTISNILRGRVELKQAHVSGILLAVGIEPERFYRLAYPRRLLLGHVLFATDFEARLEKLGLLPEELAVELPVPAGRLPETAAELERFVADAVRQALSGSGPAKRKRPRKRGGRSHPAKNR